MPAPTLSEAVPQVKAYITQCRNLRDMSNATSPILGLPIVRTALIYGLGADSELINNFNSQIALLDGV